MAPHVLVVDERFDGWMSEQARILIFTGDGKGKTTAAMGMALRAAGHGMRVRIIQFVKNDPSTGELAAFGRFDNVAFSQTGMGFIPKPDHPRFPEHVSAAETALAQANKAIHSGDWDVVVLDEICVAVALQLLSEEAVLEVMAGVPVGRILALTGRGATPKLIEAADTVTEMRCIKHAMEAGRPAQCGVES